MAAGCDHKAAIAPSPNLFSVEVTAGNKRFLGVQHKLEVISAEAALPESWQAVLSFCGTIRCEVLSSRIVAKSSGSSASGDIVMRVVPDDLGQLLAFVEKQGRVAQHETLTEDRTTQVIDTEARLQNLTKFRDSLRAMQGKPGLVVKDLVDIQQQLTDAQAQLDSEASQRRVLANETEKIAVNVAFRVDRVSGGRGFTPVGNALRESGGDLSESVALLITFLVTAVPWVIFGAPVCWVLVRWWRKWKAGRRKLMDGNPEKPSS